jgi:Cu-Zn family superoxide dismutase
MTRSNLIRYHCTIALGMIALAAAPAQAHDDLVEVGLRTVDGGEAGTATFKQAQNGVMITLDLENLTPGPHGLHIHETGACAPDFQAAGGHFNPSDAKHGFDTEGGYHVDDLPNIIVAADGTARGDVFVPKVTLRGPEDDRHPYSLSDGDGSAIMIHAQADNYRAMDSSGERAACGVIMPAGR